MLSDKLKDCTIGNNITCIFFFVLQSKKITDSVTTFKLLKNDAWTAKKSWQPLWKGLKQVFEF